MGLHQTLIPRYISAPNVDALEREMSLLARRAGMSKIMFQDIQFAQGRWYAWYLAPDDDLNQTVLPEAERRTE